MHYFKHDSAEVLRLEGERRKSTLEKRLGGQTGSCSKNVCMELCIISNENTAGAMNS